MKSSRRAPIAFANVLLCFFFVFFYFYTRSRVCIRTTEIERRDDQHTQWKKWVCFELRRIKSYYPAHKADLSVI